MKNLTKILTIALVSISLTAFNPSVYADKGGVGHGQGNGQGKAHGHGHGLSNNFHGKSVAKAKGLGHENAAAIGHGPRFTSADKASINNYFKEHPLAGTTLPPGIAKNLARGKPLPPGIAKVFLPADVVSTLPVYPDHDYMVVGRDVVLVDKTTGIVSDILTNALK